MAIDLIVRRIVATLRDGRGAAAFATPSGAPGAAPPGLDDDTVKLVEITLVSLERGAERVLDRRRMVLVDGFTATSLAASVLAAYRDLAGLGTPERLRVHHDVLARWPRQPVRFRERQLERLESLRRRLAAPPAPPTLERTILDALAAEGRYRTAAELARRLDAPAADVRHTLRRLEAAGRVIRKVGRYGLDP